MSLGPILQEVPVPQTFESVLEAIREGGLSAVEDVLSESPELAAASDHADQTALHHAAYEGTPEIAACLLAAGANVNARTAVGYTPLHYAAFAGRAGVFDQLIAAGADIHAIDDSRTTVLHAAASGGNRRIVERILAAGIAPGELNLYGESPSHRAAQRNRLDIVQHLVAAGADAAPIDRYNLTLLHKAAIGDAAETVEWLVEQGHDLEAVNLAGETPLHAAAEMGREKAVRAFLAHGANIHCRTFEQRTPLHAAASGGHAQMIDCLLNAGAAVQAVDSFGRTPLHSAALRGRAEILSVLLDAGLSAEDADAAGHTPLDLATAYGRGQARAALAERVGGLGRFDPAVVAALPSRGVSSGEMMIWYLGHSGWAIRTENRWLILDYAPGEPDRDDASILHGRIRIDELGDLPLTVFVTHHHPDHFDRRVLGWAERGAEFVFGWDVAEDCPGLRTPAQGEYTAGDIVVRAIRATDAGSAFLIEADGVRIYHAGDHTASQIPPEPAFAEGVDWLARQSAHVDIAFVPVFGCGLPETEALRAGNRTTIDRLQPRVIFPMHVGWTGYFYRRFATWARETGISTPLGIADQPGDRFRVTAEGVEQVWM